MLGQAPERAWSPQQEAIFAWFRQGQGNLVVRARAGTGKTTTLLRGVSYIADAQARILICAFNKRIQVELAEKLGDARAEAKTLHALGFAFIRKTWGNVRVDDAVEEERIVEAAGCGVPLAALIPIRKLVGLGKGMLPFGSVEALADLGAAYECEADGPEAAAWPLQRIAQVAHAAMQRAKVKDSRGRITFDDMLFVPVACGMVRGGYDWVVVDEAQDMNATQLLLAMGACRKGGHIVVVGDDKQAIYGFRGADSGSIDRLKAELKADELGLTTTYRCPKDVVAVAQGIVADFFAAEEAPAGFVAWMPSQGLTAWAGVGDAILSRTNAPLVGLCLGLIRQGTPARIEGRDIGRTLATLVRKMKASSVPEFLERLKGWADKQAARVQAHGKYVEARLQLIEDQRETLAALAEGCRSVEEITVRCSSMFADSMGQDGKVMRAASVVLSSVHKAKGLEWKKVFLLEKTLYCNGKRRDAEESNIHYVAVTRAQESLVLVREV